jgi:hypothetical protein
MYSLILSRYVQCHVHVHVCCTCVCWNLQFIHCEHYYFCRYQHSRHLVTTLNQFADVKADLPKGWEKKLNKEGKVRTCTHVHVHVGGCKFL